ncbi:UNVERIFIED_CONTAM: hypothetical protein GTU68_008838 [Idotea baltica]|nr:hypothetical protein [Idotea baltica]
MRKAVFSSLNGIRHGRLDVVDQDEVTAFGEFDSELRATIYVKNPLFYRYVATGGSLGAAEAFCDGLWECDDLTTLIQLFARNSDTSDRLGKWGNAIANLGRKFTHRMNRNTRDGSRRNIASHYDLSNQFYSLFLDETMTYSSGIFASPNTSLADASRAKYDRLCQQLQLTASDRVLEIGTGWGGFALHAAAKYGCHVTTTTISKQQHDYAAAAIASAGLSDRITLKLSDYRDLEGKFDKLVSIEMIEAVGHEFLDTFFAKCDSLLREDGMFAYQAITIPCQRYESYRRSVDFIQRYIFPGGFLPSMGAMNASIGRATDFQWVHSVDFASHYAKTLKLWRSNFNANRDAILSLGMTPSFLRMWEYYLCYCEGAFLEKQIGVGRSSSAKDRQANPSLARTDGT